MSQVTMVTGILALGKDLVEKQINTPPKKVIKCTKNNLQKVAMNTQAQASVHGILDL